MFGIQVQIQVNIFLSASSTIIIMAVPFLSDVKKLDWHWLMVNYQESNRPFLAVLLLLALYLLETLNLHFSQRYEMALHYKAEVLKY